MKTSINKTFGLRFHLKNDKIKNGLSPIYARITVDGKRVELAAKRSCAADRWNAAAGQSKGTTQEVKNLNAHLDALRQTIYDHYRLLMDANEEITATALKNSVLGLTIRSRSVMDVFNYHNDNVKKLIGKEYTASTFKRYETARKHLISFMQWQFNLQDLALQKVDHSFLCDLELYLKTEKDCTHNTAAKYITIFRKVVLMALSHDWIQKDPFRNFSCKTKEVERGFLNEDELNAILNLTVTLPRLALVKDLFIFSCFTGLAYVDVAKLSANDLIRGIDGDQWLSIARTKTKTRCNIPILGNAQAILDRYVDHPVSCERGTLLPVLSNQKLNAYLKEVADLAGITKNLTFHLARHTFATTVTLSNNVPIESISKMLGHKNIRTTQHYAKIVDRKVSEDMQALKIRLSGEQGAKAIGF
jgi:site-specific recombinase XerD